MINTDIFYGPSEISPKLILTVFTQSTLVLYFECLLKDLRIGEWWLVNLKAPKLVT